MIVTVFVILAVAAFVIAILAAMSRAPLYVSVMILALIELLRALPLGR